MPSHRLTTPTAAFIITALLGVLAGPATAKPPPEGDDCLVPIEVDLPVWPCYVDWNYTCGHGDDYDATCLGNYDGGEDIIYQLNVGNPMAVDIRLEPLGTSWTGMALDDACPPDGDCIAISTSSDIGAHTMSVYLEEGTYYLMIDTWPPPDCIPQFYLEIEEILPCAVECPEDAPHEDEPDCYLNYVDQFNGGCGSFPPVFSPITCGQTICAKSGVFPCGYSPGNYYTSRDTDWYEVVLTEESYVTWTVESEFPALFGIVDHGGVPDCYEVQGLLEWAISGCYMPESVSALLPAGTWWLWIAPYEWECAPCGSEYVATLECGPATAVCCHGYFCNDVADPSPAAEAECLAGGGSYLSGVSCADAPCDCGGTDYRGDSNCLGDGPDAYDIDHFVQAVGAPADWLAEHDCNLYCANDINCDGDVNAYDIDGFITCVGAGGCAPCP